ncbi:hypothetical protein NEF87_001035 [Candidatus Lokiarchaeum ossiferum]|uniref:Transcription regulator PadR N-terminal domain-containing protein n=1 Tax=Candidatus Lokiarchaeum ossiferum TaxID=2951803 RepID=A0ABY6HMX2_9ARCH|nr:hypothetical protein NEF87_001035 [Candidatus Lokiarchaeum sp. B-35]
MKKRKKVDLNWVERKICVWLWDREMYGLEIMKSLEIINSKISPGQLYPTLNSLTTQGYLSQRIHQKRGANRKMYTLTSKGKQIILNIFQDLMIILEYQMMAKYPLFFEDLLVFLDPSTSPTIMDFSKPYFEWVRFGLATHLKPLGRYIITSNTSNEFQLAQNRIESEDLESVMTVLQLKPKNHIKSKETELPTSSIDKALVYFTLHEDDTSWIYSEMFRVLKSNGVGLITDLLQPDRPLTIFEEGLLDMIPFHSKMGIVEENTIGKLQEVGFEIVDHHSNKGIITINFKKP